MSSMQELKDKIVKPQVPMVQEEMLPVYRAGFGDSASFDLLQRQAKLLAASALVPKEFQGNIPNCVIGLEMANRIGASPLAVLQNLYIVHGRPSWSSQFIISCINASGRFTSLAFELSGEGDKRQCVAWATDLATGARLESPPVSIDMAKKEGWFSKNGSKWQTMPELMLRYRGATLFGRLYAPEILMGMRSYEEVLDVGAAVEDRIVVEPEPVKVEVTAGLKEQMAKSKKTAKPEPPQEPGPVREAAAPVIEADVEPPAVAPPGVDQTTGEIVGEPADLFN